tara:strand:+ start:2847 stop:3482 length:636 start_codon:yes stop_codon:yes gene_type:complete
MSIWHQRWNENRIGFHRSLANPALTEHWSKLELDSSSHVLVPLCGKSLDMHWLTQQGHSVSGIEFVEKAVKEFFDDWAKKPQKTSTKFGEKFTAGNIHLYQADFFKVQPDDAPFSAWYDRAALVALPPSLRTQYVEQLRKLTTPDAKGLMVTFDYPKEEMQGPPFALSDEDVEYFFRPFFEIERLQFTDLTEEDGRELSRCSLSVFMLTRR